MIYTSPLYKLHEIKSPNCIYILRDDLIPYSFGGNKVRIADEYFKDMEKRNCDCIIGYGNARSNLCRALANMAQKNGVECHIVSPSDDDGKRKKTANSSMLDILGATVHECSKNNVAETLSGVIDELKSRGLNPYYTNGDIYGNGNYDIPTAAYYNVYNDINNRTKNEDKYDYIFVAVGTGMTYAGLVAGKILNKGTENVVGISVARTAEKAKTAIDKYLSAFLQRNNMEEYDPLTIEVIDDYLFDGYGKYGTDILNTIKMVFKSEGLPLDCTYTGKAFYGMLEYLKKNNICEKKILFIHTGGVPLFFDMLNERY